MTIAIGVTLAVIAGVLTIVDPSAARMAAATEAGDVQQRLRVAAGTLTRELGVAGAGAYFGTQAGPLVSFFAPIIPARHGTTTDDPPGTFRTDAVTILYVPETRSQASLAMPVSASSTAVTVTSEPTCPPGMPLCGFAEGMDVLIFDAFGDADVATVSRVDGVSGDLRFNRPPTIAYGAGAKIVQAVQRTYYLKADAVRKTFQLMVRSGADSADVPVVDDVVALSFEYYGEPRPPTLIRQASDPAGALTTYGPPPPALDSQIPGGEYLPGENCAFAVDPSTHEQFSRLAVLGDGSSALVKLGRAELTDGPWCPGPASPGRWDADLLRVRRIAITLRVQAGMETLRGPLSSLFVHPGPAASPSSWVPDQEIRFEIAPRNLDVGR